MTKKKYGHKDSAVGSFGVPSRELSNPLPLTALLSGRFVRLSGWDPWNPVGYVDRQPWRLASITKVKQTGWLGRCWKDFSSHYPFNQWQMPLEGVKVRKHQCGKNVHTLKRVHFEPPRNWSLGSDDFPFQTAEHLSFQRRKRGMIWIFCQSSAGIN